MTIFPHMLIVAGLMAQIGTPQLSLPVDWTALAPLPYRQPPKVTPLMTRFVARQMKAAHCPKPQRVQGRYVMQVDVAVLLAGDASVRATIPRAIDCPTVEQYTAGLVSSFARTNLDFGGGDPAGWYRATVTYAWQA